jgi:hypothetical protein
MYVYIYRLKPYEYQVVCGSVCTGWGSVLNIRQRPASGQLVLFLISFREFFTLPKNSAYTLAHPSSKPSRSDVRGTGTGDLAIPTPLLFQATTCLSAGNRNDSPIYNSKKDIWNKSQVFLVFSLLCPAA